MGLVEINITKILIRQFRKRKLKKITVHLSIYLEKCSKLVIRA